MWLWLYFGRKGGVARDGEAGWLDIVRNERVTSFWDVSLYPALSVRLARDACSSWQQELKEKQPTAMVAASLGPYGAMLAGVKHNYCGDLNAVNASRMVTQGQEYTGIYGDVSADTLAQFHRVRVCVVWCIYIGFCPDLHVSLHSARVLQLRAVLTEAPDLIAWETSS